MKCLFCWNSRVVCWWQLCHHWWHQRLLSLHQYFLVLVYEFKCYTLYLCYCCNLIPWYYFVLPRPTRHMELLNPDISNEENNIMIFLLCVPAAGFNKMPVIHARSLLRHLLGLRIHIIGKCNRWFMNRYMSTHPIDDYPFCVIRWIDHVINLFIETNIFLHINSAQTVVITMALLSKCLGNEYMFAVGDTHCKSLLIVHVPCICTDIAYWTEHYIVWYISAELSLGDSYSDVIACNLDLYLLSTQDFLP